MSVTFGSVGDIIAVSILIKDVAIALDDAQGSAAEYQSLQRQLHSLDLALLSIERLRLIVNPTPELASVFASATEIGTQCRHAIQSFRAKNVNFDKYLSKEKSGTGSFLKSSATKIRWAMTEKAKEVSKLQAEISSYTDSLNILLSTAGIAALDMNATQSRESTSMIAGTARRDLYRIHKGTKENTKLARQGNRLVEKLVGQFKWIFEIGLEIKQQLNGLRRAIDTVHHEVLAIRQAVAALSSVSESVSEKPFMFEDAFGRIYPIHLSYIISWAAFHAVLATQYQSASPMIRELAEMCLKSLVDFASGRKISTLQDICDAVQPGSRVVRRWVVLTVMNKEFVTYQLQQSPMTIESLTNPNGAPLDLGSVIRGHTELFAPTPGLNRLAEEAGQVMSSRAAVQLRSVWLRCVIYYASTGQYAYSVTWVDGLPLP